MALDDEFSNAFIARVAGLLDEFHTGDRLTLSELSTRTGLPRSSTHRLLTQLVEHGWVSKRGKTYALGRTSNGARWRGTATVCTEQPIPSCTTCIRRRVSSCIWPSSKVATCATSTRSDVDPSCSLRASAGGSRHIAPPSVRPFWPTPDCTPPFLQQDARTPVPREQSICCPATRSHIFASDVSRTSVRNRCRVSRAWRHPSETGRRAWAHCP